MENIENKQEKIEALAQTVIDFLTDSSPENELPKADAIFVFGHYDHRLAEHAAKLWKAGKAARIIISGKGREKIPEGFASEADYYASLLVKSGVPESALVLERDSTNTLENVLLGMRKAETDGMHLSSLILVSIPPLLRRARATFAKQFPDVETYGSAFGISSKEWITEVRLRRVIGECDRLQKYAGRGDIVPVQIPDSVDSAVSELRELIK